VLAWVARWEGAAPAEPVAKKARPEPRPPDPAHAPAGAWRGGAQRFMVHAILTDGLGRIDHSLVIARLDTFEEVYTRSWSNT